MRVAVVTPYFKEPLEILSQCAQSVRAQTAPCTHILIADGHPRLEFDGLPGVQHFQLPVSHGDTGDTPRAIGSISAASQGFDAVAYLDADNWYDPRHIAGMIELHQQTKAAVCSAGVRVHRLDGTFLCDDRETDGKNHVDTSALFVTREAFGIFPMWAMIPAQLGTIGDRIIWNFIKVLKLTTAHRSEATVVFRSGYEYHYRNNGEAPPLGAIPHERRFDAAMDWWFSLEPDVRAGWERKLCMTLGVKPVG